MSILDVQTELPRARIAFDIEAFDAALRDYGVQFDHYKAMRCPDGMVDIGDNRQPHPDHSGCQGGFLFEKVGTVTGLFVGNSKEKKQDDMGFWDGSSVQITVPRYYDDQPETKVFLAPFDRLYARDSLPIETWQLLKVGDGQSERLKYPALEVFRLRSSRGQEFKQGRDFNISNGRIVWLGSSKPQAELDMGPGYNGFGTEKSVVCSVRYNYQPFYYVGRVLHEIRVSQGPDDEGKRVAQRMPQSVLIHREYMMQGNPADEAGAPGADADTMRTAPTPRNFR